MRVRLRLLAIVRVSLNFGRRLIALPVSFAALLFLRLRYQTRVIRIVLMDSTLFGHQCLEPEVFFYERQMASNNAPTDVWFCCIGKKSRANSKFMWKLQRRSLPTIPSWIVSELSSLSSRFLWTKIRFEAASIYRVGFLNSTQTRLPQSERVSSRRFEILSRMSDPMRPYVVFTVRERDSAARKHDPRNREISDFYPAMMALTSRGFNVVRLTDSTHDPMSIENPHVLDWVVSECGKPGDELALMSGARFVVSTTTGGDCLALAYRKPVLYVDCFRLSLVFLASELATFQLSRMRDTKTGHVLDIESVLSRGLGWEPDHRRFASAGVVVEKSTPTEIREITLEYVCLLDALPKSEEVNSQEKWRALLLEHHRKEVDALRSPIQARLHPRSIRDLNL